MKHMQSIPQYKYHDKPMLCLSQINKNSPPSTVYQVGSHHSTLNIIRYCIKKGCKCKAKDLYFKPTRDAPYIAFAD